MYNKTRFYSCIAACIALVVLAGCTESAQAPTGIAPNDNAGNDGTIAYVHWQQGAAKICEEYRAQAMAELGAVVIADDQWIVHNGNGDPRQVKVSFITGTISIEIDPLPGDTRTLIRAACDEGHLAVTIDCHKISENEWMDGEFRGYITCTRNMALDSSKTCTATYQKIGEYRIWNDEECTDLNRTTPHYVWACEVAPALGGDD